MTAFYDSLGKINEILAVLEHEAQSSALFKQKHQVRKIMVLQEIQLILKHMETEMYLVIETQRQKKKPSSRIVLATQNKNTSCPNMKTLYTVDKIKILYPSMYLYVDIYYIGTFKRLKALQIHFKLSIFKYIQKQIIAFHFYPVSIMSFFFNGHTHSIRD